MTAASNERGSSRYTTAPGNAYTASDFPSQEMHDTSQPVASAQTAGNPGTAMPTFIIETGSWQAAERIAASALMARLRLKEYRG